MTQDIPLPEGVTIPRDARLERIEESYGPLADAVHCGLCATPHKTGYVVAFMRSNETARERGIIGHVCGHREFKETWTQAVARHEAELRDAEVREELKRFLESIGDIEPQLQELLARLEIYDAIYRLLSIDARDFMRHCADACRTGNGRLEGPNYSGRKLTHRLEGQPFFSVRKA